MAIENQGYVCYYCYIGHFHQLLTLWFDWFLLYQGLTWMSNENMGKKKLFKRIDSVKKMENYHY